MRSVSYVFKDGFETKVFAEAETLKSKLGFYEVRLDEVVEVPEHIRKKREKLGLA